MDEREREFRAWLERWLPLDGAPLPCEIISKARAIFAPEAEAVEIHNLRTEVERLGDLSANYWKALNEAAALADEYNGDEVGGRKDRSSKAGHLIRLTIGALEAWDARVRPALIARLTRERDEALRAASTVPAECRHENAGIPDQQDEFGRDAQYPAHVICPDCGADVEVR